MANPKQAFETAVYCDMTLKPHRSMTDEGRKYFYGGLIATGAITNYFALKAGAWPIALYLDIALGGLAIAMRASDLGGKNEYETIKLTDKALELRRYKPGGTEELITLSPYMLKVEACMDRFDICEKVLLVSRNRKIEIGAFLPPEDKQRCAVELARALEQYNLPHHLRNKQKLEL